jgi:hypothetical protein
MRSRHILNLPLRKLDRRQPLPVAACMPWPVLDIRQPSERGEFARRLPHRCGAARSRKVSPQCRNEPCREAAASGAQNGFIMLVQRARASLASCQITQGRVHARKSGEKDQNFCGAMKSP